MENFEIVDSIIDKKEFLSPEAEISCFDNEKELISAYNQKFGNHPHKRGRVEIILNIVGLRQLNAFVLTQILGENETPAISPEIRSKIYQILKIKSSSYYNELIAFRKNINEFEAVANKNNDITNRITPETRCDLWVQLLKLQSMIQSNLSLQDGGNDTTILNFGISLKLRTPLLTTGHDPKFISQNSIQFAAIVAYFSGFLKIPVDAGFVFTGAFDDNGKTIQVGDTGLKIDWIIRKRPAVKKIFIPKSDSYSPDEQLIISDNSDKIIVISDMEDLLHNAFGDSLKNLLKFSKEKLHELGAVRIITTLMGKRSIGIKHLWLDELPPFKENEYNTIYAKMSDGEISGSNIREIYTTLPPASKQMILLDGRFPLFWLGAYIHASKNSARLIAIKYRTTENYIIMASDEGDKELIGKQFKFKWKEE